MTQETFHFNTEYFYVDIFDELDDGVVSTFVSLKALYVLKVLMRYANIRESWVDEILHDDVYMSVDDDQWDDILTVIAEQEEFFMSPYERVLADVTLESDETLIDVSGLNYNETGPWMLTVLVDNPKSSTVGVSFFVNSDDVSTNYYTQVLSAIAGTRASVRNNNALFAWNAALLASVHTGMVSRNPGGYVTWMNHGSRYGGSSVDFVSRYVTHKNTQSNITEIQIKANTSTGLGAGTRLLLTRMGV